MWGSKMPMTLSAAPNHAQIRSLDSRIRPVQLDGGEDQPVSTTLASYLRKLRPFSTRQHFGRNEVIFQEVDPTERVYRGISGMVRTCRHTANGTRHVADFVLPGELIANAECAEHPFTAEAITPVTLIGYARSSFDRLASSVPAVRVRLVSLLSTNLLTAQRQLFVLGSQTARQRIASFVLRLADRGDVTRGERLDIADHLGMTIETLCRAIAALRDDRVITVPNSKQLILNDIAASRAIAVAA
jgi:CRP-like cAMP-binding protein